MPQNIIPALIILLYKFYYFMQGVFPFLRIYAILKEHKKPVLSFVRGGQLIFKLFTILGDQPIKYLESSLELFKIENINGIA